MATGSNPQAACDPLDPIRQLLYQALVQPYRGVLELPHPSAPVVATPDVAATPKSSAPNRQMLFNYLADLSTEDAFKNADTIVVLADNRPPAHPELDFMQHTFRMLVERCSQVCGERWTVIFVPLDATTGLAGVHYTWGATYSLEILAAMFPAKHVILMDNDAAPTTLWEVADLQQLAQQFGFPGPTFCHVFSEHVSYVNAGIMVFPGDTATTGPARAIVSYEEFQEYRRQTLRRMKPCMPLLDCS